MAVFKSGEDYLEAILRLQEKKDGVHAIDVVNLLGFSKPSVSIALKKLKDEGYITIDDNSHLNLTADGLKIAEAIYERHKTITELFVNMGISADVAEDDACKIEHDISLETFNAIKKYNDILKNSPHKAN